MADPVALSRALVRGRIRVLGRGQNPIHVTVIPSSGPSPPRPDLFGQFKRGLPGISPYVPAHVASVEKPKTSQRLHSAARPASGFLQVAPIETASARTPQRSRAFTSEAVPIGR